MLNEPDKISQIKEKHFLESLLNPKSIAIYGANENLMTNMGSQQLLNIIDNGYKGRVYPIHPRLDTVMGLNTYRNIGEIPEIPDLVIVILPTKIIPNIFVEIGEKGVKNVVLVTAGFRETDNDKGEVEIKKIAHKYGFRFLGPNCLGYQNTHTHYLENTNDNSNFNDKNAENFASNTSQDTNSTCILNFTWVTYKMKPGNVSIASQSGTFAAHINFLMEERDLNMSKCLSIGNEADVDICDCLEYFEHDETTEVILLYIEEIKRGRNFFEIIKRITPKKPVVALYVGGSKGGATAVSGHTGSIAGNDSIYNAIFQQTGVIRVYNLEELMDTAVALSKLLKKKAIPKGKRIGILTNAGGPGAIMADYASRIGLEIPKFSDELQNKLKKFLPATAQASQASNPLDYTFSINPLIFFKKVPEIVAKSGEVDALIIYGAYGPDFFSYQSVGKEIFAKKEIQKLINGYIQLLESAVDSSRRLIKKYRIPIFYINLLGSSGDKVVGYLNKRGFCTYKYPHQAVRTIDNLIKYGLFLKKNNF